MSLDDDIRTAHSRHSVLREKIIESLFVGALGREIWNRGEYDLEILRSEFDAAGYDLVLVKGPVIRHVQLKVKLSSGRRTNFDISTKLSEKPSGCVICILVSDDLSFEGYKWFGARAGCALPSLEEFPISRHSKANSKGEKLHRTALRRVPLSRFESVDCLTELLKNLFDQPQ